MSERSIAGPEMHLNERGWASKHWFTELNLLRHELLVIVLFAVFLLTQIACGGGGNNLVSGTVHNYATGKGPTSVAAADFNGDKILDLAVASVTDNTVSVLLGNEDGTFRQHVDYPAGTYLSAIAVGDFNGDGKQDLVTDSGLLLGNGDGTFQAMLPFPDSASETKLVHWHSTTASTSTDSTLAVGDFNGDGKPDLLGGGVLLGNGDGTFRAGGGLPVGGINIFSVGLGDFNGDSKMDVFLFSEWTGSNQIIAIQGNGDGTFSSSPEIFALGVEVGWGFALSDFNADGKLDIVAGGPGGVSILMGNGDGTFQWGASPGTAGIVQAIAVADLNADGKPDLVVINEQSQPGGYDPKAVNAVSILLGNGDGTFQPHIDYGTGTTPAASVAVGDFNGDGKPDLAVTKQDDNTVSILFGNGDGTFK